MNETDTEDTRLMDTAAEVARRTGQTIEEVAEGMRKMGEAAEVAGAGMKTALAALTPEKQGKPTSPRYRRAVRRHEKRQQAMTEHEKIAARYQPSARELFLTLRDMRRASRPLLGHAPDGSLVYGGTTYRNVVELGDDGQMELV